MRLSIRRYALVGALSIPVVLALAGCAADIDPSSDDAPNVVAGNDDDGTASDVGAGRDPGTPKVPSLPLPGSGTSVTIGVAAGSKGTISLRLTATSAAKTVTVTKFVRYESSDLCTNPKICW